MSDATISIAPEKELVHEQGHAEAAVRIPLVTGNKTVHDVSNDIAGRVEEKPSLTWMLAMARICSFNSGWNTTTSSMRLMNSGRKCLPTMSMRAPLMAS